MRLREKLQDVSEEKNCISHGLPSENDSEDSREDSVDNEDEEEDDDANPEIGLDQIRCDVWLDYYGVVAPTPTAKIFKHEKYIDLNLI